LAANRRLVMLWPLYDSIRCALPREPSQRLQDRSHIKIVHRWRSRRIADLLKLLHKIIRSRSTLILLVTNVSDAQLPDSVEQSSRQLHAPRHEVDLVESYFLKVSSLLFHDGEAK